MFTSNIESIRPENMGAFLATKAGEEYLDKLIQSGDEEALLKVVSIPEVPVTAMVKIANLEGDLGRFALNRVILTNQPIPKEMLERLAESTEVRTAVVQNPNTSPEVLAEDAKRLPEEESDVALATAKNPNAPKKILDELAKSPRIEVRAEVAQNPNTRFATRAELLFDSEPAVREAAKAGFKGIKNS